MTPQQPIKLGANTGKVNTLSDNYINNKIRITLVFRVILFCLIT